MNNLPKTLPKFIFSFVRKQGKGFLLAQLCCFGWSIDHTFWPLIIMKLVDAINSFAGDRSNSFAAIAPILLMGGVLWIFVELSFRFAGILMTKLFPKMEADIRMSVFNYVLHHSFSFFSDHFAGSIANKISDLPQTVTRIMQLGMTLFFPVFLAMILAISFFAMVQPTFALILLGWIVTHISICLLFAKKCDALSHIHAEARTHLAGNIVDSISNHLNVKLFARNRYEIQYTNQFQKDEQKKHEDSLWYVEKMKIFLGLNGFLIAGVLLNWVMISYWQQGLLTAGEVVFIFNTSWNITMMVWLAGLEIPNLFKEIGVAKQALTIIQEPHTIVDSPHAKELKNVKGEIIFDKVSFQYTPNVDLFQNKTLEIKAGEKIGLVGFSGSGKTSFINLILRHYDVTEGKILIDGQDISKVTLDSLHESIAMIPQDAALFHRTLLENIRYGKIEATNDEVIAASKKAHCHDFIEKLPLGYNTLVGDRGLKLSGGQRQRIAIARAVLKNAPILILDEATSALDSVTEKHIQEDLYELMKDRTAIVVAHRLSTIASLDRILVFDQGKVIEEGTHEELLGMNGHYAHMWEMQAGGFLPDDEGD